MNDLEAIKDRIDVVELIGSYITMKKAGRNYKANCPFHKEKTPSFMISPDKQIWHCFGCGKGGDAFGFIMEMEGMDFPEALRFLAQKAGVEIKQYVGDRSDSKNILYELNDLAVSFYHKILTEDKDGEIARSYLKERGLNENTIMDFKLGYSPNSFTMLVDFLRSKGFKDVDILRAGLAVKKDNGSLADRFYKRLMFPIVNQAGSTVGFTARVLTDEKTAKYINTPETPVYEKSKVLFGIDKAKREMGQKDWVVVVEGNMDVISSFQSGVTNVVAASGTALTLDQLKIIKRYTSNVIMALDKDSAGADALKRAIFISLEENMNIKIIDMGSFKDPDEMIKKDPNLWKKALKASKPFMDFYISDFFGTIEKLDVTEKKKIARELLPFLKRMNNEIEKTHYTQELSKKLSVPEESLRDAMAKVESTSFNRPRNLEEKETVPKKSAKQITEENLLGLIFAYPDLSEEVIGLLEARDFSDDDTRKIFKTFQTMYLEKGKAQIDDFGDDVKPKISELSFIAEEDNKDNDHDDIWKEVKFCFKRLKELNVDSEKDDLQKEIILAEEKDDQEKIGHLMETFQDILDKEKKIKEF